VAERLRIGFKLSSEEHDAHRLVELAGAAEEAGFDTIGISDHFHPWIDKEGQSPFVWAVLGGIAARTNSIEVGTLVTCPSSRVHPAIVAQAAATVATMMPDRFFLGVGTGENLNEHVTGARWPDPGTRRAMLEEAVHMIRALWEGELYSEEGSFFTVESARIYSRPPSPPPIYVAAGGEEAAELAGRIGNGLVGTAPEPETIETFRSSGGNGKRTIAELTICFAPSREEALATAMEIWPIPGIPGELTAELPLPRHFEQAAKLVRPKDLEEKIPLGPDVESILAAVEEYRAVGFDTIVLHQIGPEQGPLLKFAGEELLPALREGAFVAPPL
jgi:coenzyme F420-dependent glucose-6-phosphate dehydrogenase